MQHVSDFSTIAAGSRVGIKASEIPNSGRGLYTYDAIREGKTVGEYFGWEVNKDQDYGDLNDIIASYSMGNHDGSKIYCAFSLGTQAITCMMAYINDPLDDLMCNVRSIWNGHRCRIVAVRDIEANEEFKMAYGDTFWMRDIFPYTIIERAWENYGTRRTNADWTTVYQRRIAMEEAEESEPEESESEDEDSDEDEQSIWEEDWPEERETMFRQRIVIDLTVGDEPVEIIEMVEIIAPAEPEVIPYTLDSPELYEDYSIIRNSCA